MSEPQILMLIVFLYVLVVLSIAVSIPLARIGKRVRNIEKLLELLTTHGLSHSDKVGDSEHKND